MKRPADTPASPAAAHLDRADDSPARRRRYICLIGLAALLPFAFVTRGYPGEFRDAGFLALVALFFVTLYIRSDRRRAASRAGEREAND